MRRTTLLTRLRLPPESRRWCLAAATAVVLVATTLLAPPPGRAFAATLSRMAVQPTYTTVVTDRNDTDGPLDIARVKHRIRVIDRQHARIGYTVATYTSYAAHRLNVRKRNFVIELNRDGNPGSERNIRVSYSSGRLVAEVISNATRETLASLAVKRPGSRMIRISASRELIGARSYFWTSTFHARWSGDCGFGDGYPITCQDTVPGSGWIRMDRPAWPTQV